jgi:hypothetical protein
MPYNYPRSREMVPVGDPPTRDEAIDLLEDDILLALHNGNMPKAVAEAQILAGLALAELAGVLPSSPSGW